MNEMLSILELCSLNDSMTVRFRLIIIPHKRKQNHSEQIKLNRSEIETKLLAVISFEYIHFLIYQSNADFVSDFVINQKCK